MCNSTFYTTAKKKWDVLIPNPTNKVRKVVYWSHSVGLSASLHTVLGLSGVNYCSVLQRSELKLQLFHHHEDLHDDEIIIVFIIFPYCQNIFHLHWSTQSSVICLELLAKRWRGISRGLRSPVMLTISISVTFLKFWNLASSRFGRILLLFM